jgi:hypothetical protein
LRDVAVKKRKEGVVEIEIMNAFVD